MSIKHDRATHEAMDRLLRDGVLVDLDVRYWRATRVNTARDLGLKKSRVPGFVVGLGTKRLLSPEDVNQWNRFADNARYAIEKASYRFPIGEARFVPRARVEALVKVLDEMKSDFETSVTDFLRHYETLREEWLARFPEHRARLEGEYPPRREIESKFSFDYTLYSVTMPKSIRRARAEDAAEARWQKKLNEKMESFVTDVVTTLRAEAVEVCSDIADKIAKNEIISDGSLVRARKFLDNYKTLNFVKDPEVETKLDNLKKQLADRTAAQFATDEASRTMLAAALSEARKAAENITDISAVTGQYRRRIKD